MKQTKNENITQEELSLAREKATVDWIMREEENEKENKRLHDIVQKRMQPLFDRNRKIVLEKMKKEAEQNNKTREQNKQPQEHLM